MNLSRKYLGDCKMSENNGLDFESIMDELSSNIEDMLEDILMNQVEDAVISSLQDALPEALSESLTDYEFVLPNGTHVRPRQYMKVLSPDKTKLMLCYGGLRVDGRSLIVQTRISCWETIAVYQSKEDAVEALLKVKKAMDAGAVSFEL